MRDFQLPGRSAAMAMNGMAATHNPHATRVAIEVLKSGGAAIDAAVAASAVLAVVEPQQTGIGGDCFVLMSLNGSDKIIGYNGSGRTPRGLPTEGLADSSGQLGDSSPHTVTIPGAIDAWTRLVNDHGRKDIGELLQPAIAFARDGFPVHPRVARDWIDDQHRLRLESNAARVFLPNDRPLRAGKSLGIRGWPMRSASSRKRAVTGSTRGLLHAISSIICAALAATTRWRISKRLPANMSSRSARRIAAWKSARSRQTIRGSPHF